MKAAGKVFLLLITHIHLQAINPIYDFKREKIVSNHIMLPTISSETTNNCKIKQKGIINYLFCNISSSENSEFVDLKYKLSIQPNGEHEGLRSLTPETYGALPLTQNHIVYYLTSLQNSSLSSKKNIFTVTPFHYWSHYNKEKPLPTFEYNTSGFSIDASGDSTFLKPAIGLSYCHTDTKWQAQKNTSTTHNIYMYPSLKYNDENVFCSATVVGGYTFHNVKRVLQTASRPSVYSTPHSWELASTLVGGYLYNTTYITFIPQLNFTQTNVFQSSIKENNHVSLKAASKNFRYLNMSFSLTIKPHIKQFHPCIAPSIQFGWRSIRQLSDRNFIAKLDTIIDRSSYFITETYNSNLSLFFLEGTISISHKASQHVELSYRSEFDKKMIASGLSAQIIWEF